MEHVVLVDEHDNVVGTMEKLEAHQKGILHRAFSILLFNERAEVLLQKRSSLKYHSGGLWTNTCCSHPLPGESMQQATERKLEQEMGLRVKMEFAYSFIYKTTLDKNLIEHELDHVFFGSFSGEPTINPEEVEDWKYVSLKSLQAGIVKHPEAYTYWFRLIINHPQLQNILDSKALND